MTLADAPAARLPGNLAELVDESIGLVRRLFDVPPQPGEPTRLIRYSVSVSDPSRYSGWRNDLVGSGFGFTDPQACMAAAVGEAVERYCGNFIPFPDVTASWNELDERGIPAVRPTRFSQFTAAQCERAGTSADWPYVMPPEDKPIEWSEAEVLTAADASTVLVPSSLVYLNFRQLEHRRKAPHWHTHTFAGIAAGSNLAHASASALREIIERDATMLWWVGNREARRIEVPAESVEWRTVTDGVDTTVLDLWWLLLPDDFGIPTIAGVLLDREHDVLTVGFATREDPQQALYKAAAEAFQLRQLSLSLLDSEGWMRRAVDEGIFGTDLPPHRPDRDYGSSFAPDLADMTQLLFNTQYYLDRSTWEPALQRLRPGRSIPLGDIPASAAVGQDHQQQLDTLVAACARAGLDVLRVDITSDDVTPTGVRVARVIVPGACGNTATAYPPLGNSRLQDTLARTGSPFLAPLPHS
jgi:ribosomal protein S12 methylthiotransferase accessory factor